MPGYGLILVVDLFSWSLVGSLGGKFGMTFFFELDSRFTTVHSELFVRKPLYNSSL